jgi:hypothetical protein
VIVVRQRKVQAARQKFNRLRREALALTDPAMFCRVTLGVRLRENRHSMPPSNASFAGQSTSIVVNCLVNHQRMRMRAQRSRVIP